MEKSIDKELILLNIENITLINSNRKDIDAIYLTNNNDNSSTIVFIKNNLIENNNSIITGTNNIIENMYQELGFKLNIEYTTEFNYMTGYNDNSKDNFYRTNELLNSEILCDKTGKYIQLKKSWQEKNKSKSLNLKK